MSRCNLAILILLILAPAVSASDWTRFRGENGSGINADSVPAPVEWSETKNLKWSAKLPGPGKSSPIIVGDRVIVTCWTGDNPPEDLQRQILCFNRQTGEVMWQKTIAPLVPDETFSGMFTENGYASHTPASDGERIFAFFGKSGVLCFDMDGNQRWQQSVGDDKDPSNWGTASSLVLYKDLVIVTAASESRSLVALRKDNGEEVWRQEVDGLRGTWGTPVLADAEGGRQDLVIAVPSEVWGINPDTGKLRWYAAGPGGNAMCTSAVTADGIVFVLGGREGGSVALRAGGSGDLADSHIVWRGNQRGGIGTPVLADGLIYWVAEGVANCIDAATGERVYQSRLKPPAAPSETSETSATAATANVANPDSPPAAPPAAEPPPVQGFGRAGQYANFGGGRPGGGGHLRGADYSSPVAAAGNLYFVRRSGDVYVLKLGRDFEQLAVNKFASDGGDFSATPAVSDGEIFIRSSEKLYCVAGQ